MDINQDPVPPPIPQRGTAVIRGSEVKPHRHPDGADGATPKRVNKYGLLVLEELAGYPASADIQERRDGHKATMGRGDQDERDMETEEWTGQRALLTCGMPEESDKERRPPERQARD